MVFQLIGDLEPRFKINSGTYVKDVSSTVMHRTYEAWVAMICEYPTTSNSIIIWEFYHMDKVASVPLSDTAFTGRTKVLSS
jgi:hypothetical protein